jgi:hypothetical protein
MLHGLLAASAYCSTTRMRVRPGAAVVGTVISSVSVASTPPPK